MINHRGDQARPIPPVLLAAILAAESGATSDDVVVVAVSALSSMCVDEPLGASVPLTSEAPAAAEKS